ncbi:hypothetical protein FRC06_011874 [Ceratobasidium sp. 370]|nr:hypothetical protein FRC06_011874 [Ceratobasidium sp. 370]
MASGRASTNDDWLETIMRQVFSQARNTSRSSPKAAMEEIEASQAARDTLRIAKVAMQMVIGMLDAAEEKQDEADRLFRTRLKTIEKERKAEKLKEQQRLAQEEQQRQLEQARQAEVEEMRKSMERFRQEEKEQARMLEERKREARRQREEVERRAAEQATAEALKRAQAEAKKYREAAERAKKEASRAQERAEQAEEAQRQYAARAKSDQASKDQQKESTAWSHYTGQWELFKRFALAVEPSSKEQIFRFEDIPWPMLSPPTSPSMITKDQVAAFLLSSSSGQGKPLKARIRECLLTWHPDKFSGRAEEMLKEIAEEAVKARMGEMAEELQGTAESEDGQMVLRIKAYTLYGRYRNRLDLSTRLARSLEVPVLNCSDIPWPAFNIPPKPEDITDEGIWGFVDASLALQPAISCRKKMLKARLFVWHPDRFCGRKLSYVVESERELVQRGISTIARLLNDIMNKTES